MALRLQCILDEPRQCKTPKHMTQCRIRIAPNFNKYNRSIPDRYPPTAKQE